MTLLWAVPPVAVAMAAALVLLHLPGITESVVALREELHRLSAVRQAVEEVRSASAETRVLVRSLRP